ncbi:MULTISPECIES: SRPBCC family protein [unclassified Dysgonomonas]|uniref:SRPBCC family protein n=1 Tax=unclassified Dysgonomonas TaxID=2630389 RepID=UPI0025C3B2C2|nr:MULTISPECIES: SRPBCC family protein [unclassified Dysgonomonas]HMM04810.1 SRPBCC family protein [Dysgonomonas sp.]
MNNIPIIIEEIYPEPLSKVWKAITDKNQMKEWYFTIEDFELREGAEFNFTVSFEDVIYHHRCVIKEIVPQKRFSHTWTHPSQSKGESVVTWDLQPVDNGTKVVLTHEGVENFADAGAGFSRENYVAGWEEISGTSLRNFLSK